VLEGVIACLAKPFDVAILFGALKKALHLQRPSERCQPEERHMSIDPTSRLSGSPPTPRHTPVVFVVDDDISVRESLELLIRNEGWEPLLFESARDFLARSSVPAPSCLILDVHLPDLNGLDLQQRITGETSTPIIFITGYGDVPTSVKAMKAGAAEFLTKPFDDTVMIAAISSALLRSSAAFEKESVRRHLQNRFASLSNREREVMTLVVKGLMNKQVGGELDISEITVKAHRGRVMDKMRATTIVDLVHMATELGIGAAPKA
jgi:FixJ family two-component response regulator